MLTAPRALVAAAALLVVASGGVGYAAGHITGQQIKDGSVTGKDIKNKSLTGKDVKNKSLGAKKLAAGVLPRDVEVVARHKVLSSSELNGFLSVSCLRGEQAVGGHAGLNGGNMSGVSYFSPGGQPVIDNDTGRVTGWMASWANKENHSNSFRVTALCIPLP